jgi:hypothetical protein
MKTCTSCGAEVAEDGKFCSECGATFVAAPTPSASVAPPPPPPAGYAPVPPPPPPAGYAPAPPAAPAAYAPAPPPYPPTAYPPAAQPSPKGNQALIIAAVAVVVVVAGVGSWFLFFNKPATDTGKPNVAQTTTTTTTTTTTNPTDSADAAGVVAKLNEAIGAGDSTAWDSLWDGAAVSEYVQPLLVDAVENGDAWSQIVEQVGSESEARTRLENALTVPMLEQELRKAIFGAKALFGTVDGTTVNGNTATVSTVDGNGDAIALKLEKRPTGWVVVGFDSDVFISSFVTSFEDTVLGR